MTTDLTRLSSSASCPPLSLSPGRLPCSQPPPHSLQQSTIQYYRGTTTTQGKPVSSLSSVTFSQPPGRVRLMCETSEIH